MVLRTYEKLSTSSRSILSFNLLQMTTRARNPVVDMSAKIEEAKRWLGPRWIGREEVLLPVDEAGSSRLPDA